ncbi:hypothetical protein [Burkholderia sp. Ax-1719]|uniref:hypothetical protein n=1 Tax=Burkholderia sp. Ax-1719 TaxID=2608334 RepID=UPI001F049A85|nr:hypothetical protein [Burkholderia sp. Ax-1719]
MGTDVTSFTRVPQTCAATDETHEGATGSTCRRGGRGDIESVVHRFQFVTRAFEKPQTVFRFDQRNGWLRYDDVCSVTGAAGRVGLHKEGYSRP